MAKESKTSEQLPDRIAGQHLSLAAAAHLAYAQLAPPHCKASDANQLRNMLDVVAAALTRTATLYVTDPQTGAPRPLTYAEVMGATPKRAATLLVLEDGGTLAGVSLRRDELRQAIAILMAVGLPGVTAPPRPPEKPAVRELPAGAVSLQGRP